MKIKKIIAFMIVIFLLISIGGAMIYNKVNNHYATKINKTDIAQITGLNLDNFDVVDSYTKKNNVNSSCKFKFYNELLIVKLNAINTDDNNINYIPDDFEICDTNIELIENVKNYFCEYNISWIKNFENSDVIWYKRIQQFEDKNIKSSVTLYFLKAENSNEYYIILDQINV